MLAFRSARLLLSSVNSYSRAFSLFSPVCNQDQTTVLKHEAQNYYNLKDYNNCFKSATEALKLHPKDESAWMLRIRSLISLGKDAQAYAEWAPIFLEQNDTFKELLAKIENSQPTAFALTPGRRPEMIGEMACILQCIVSLLLAHHKGLQVEFEPVPVLPNPSDNKPDLMVRYKAPNGRLINILVVEIHKDYGNKDPQDDFDSASEVCYKKLKILRWTNQLETVPVVGITTDGLLWGMCHLEGNRNLIRTVLAKMDGSEADEAKHPQLIAGLAGLILKSLNAILAVKNLDEPKNYKRWS